MARQRDQVVFRLSEQLLSKLDGLVRKSGRTRSELLREAVEQYLERALPSARAAEPRTPYGGRAPTATGEGIRTEETLERIVRAGVRALRAQPYRATTFSMGEPLVPSLDKSLRIASALEDEETARKLSLRK